MILASERRQVIHKNSGLSQDVRDMPATLGFVNIISVMHDVVNVARLQTGVILMLFKLCFNYLVVFLLGSDKTDVMVHFYVKCLV